MPFRLPQRRDNPLELAPEGTHAAACALVATLGTQPNQYGPKPQVVLGFNLLDVVRANGEPFTPFRTYTISSHPKSTLMVDLESMLGRRLPADFDLITLIGRTCSVGLVHADRGDRTYANISSVMLPPRGTPERVACSGVAFSLDDETFDQASFDRLPNWVRTRIAASPEYQAIVDSPGDVKAALARVMTPPPRVDDLDDDIPFITCNPAAEPYLKRRVVA